MSRTRRSSDDPSAAARWAGRTLMEALVAGGVLLLVFGPRPEAGLPADPGIQVVTYWEKWTGPEAAQMQQIVDDFNATVGRDKRVYVQFVSMADVTQKMLVSTAAGVPPDVAGTWDAYLTYFAALGALEPLDDLAAARGVGAADYKPVYWNGCQYRGRLYGLPSSSWCIALYYNKRIFRENAAALRGAGLDPDRPPATLAELDAYARVLDARDARGRLDRTGYMPLYPGFHVAHAPLWFGGRLYDPAADRLTLTDPACVRAFAWVRGYSERLGVDSMAEFRSGFGGSTSALSPFLQGKMAMEQERPTFANYIANLKPSMNRWGATAEQKAAEKSLPSDRRRAMYEWGVAPFPSAVPPGLADVTFAGFDALVVPKGAKHKAAAFEFIAYVNRQDVMEKLCSLQGANSCLARVSDRFIRDHPNPYIDVFERLAHGPNAHGLPPVPIWPEVGTEMGVVAEEVYLLRKTPEQALGDAQRRLQERYDDFRAVQRARGE